jgi:hypothetical protein
MIPIRKFSFGLIGQKGPGRVKRKEKRYGKTEFARGECGEGDGPEECQHGWRVEQGRVEGDREI